MINLAETFRVFFHVYPISYFATLHEPVKSDDVKIRNIC